MQMYFPIFSTIYNVSAMFEYDNIFLLSIYSYVFTIYFCLLKYTNFISDHGKNLTKLLHMMRRTIHHKLTSILFTFIRLPGILSPHQTRSGAVWQGPSFISTQNFVQEGILRALSRSQGWVAGGLPCSAWANPSGVKTDAYWSFLYF